MSPDDVPKRPLVLADVPTFLSPLDRLVHDGIPTSGKNAARSCVLDGPQSSMKPLDARRCDRLAAEPLPPQRWHDR